MTDADIEKEIQDKGLTAPRLTPDYIESLIAGEFTTTLDRAFNGAPTLPSMAVFTICTLVLKNGYIVIGESAPVSAENFDRALGHKIARQKAKDKIWAVAGYALRDKLAGL